MGGSCRCVGGKKVPGINRLSAGKMISDHQPLRWLMSVKSPSGRLAPWALKLQGFDLEIDYIPVKCN